MSALHLGLCQRSGQRLFKQTVLSLYRPVSMLPTASLSCLRAYTSATRLPDAEARKPTLEIDPFQRGSDFKRPIAPHLSIYQPQLTWYLSALHRITGAGVAAGLYFVLFLRLIG